MGRFADGKGYRQPRRVAVLWILAVLSALSACSSKVGVSTSGNPSAVVTPIGHKAVSGAGTSAVTIRVRSGTAVILSGKDSTGNGAALAGFHWTQTGGPALPSPPDVGALLYQTADTVEFTAPQVATDTSLAFQLTVTDALGVSSSASATVVVTAANDPDEFLIPTIVDNGPGNPRRFSVAVATSAGLTPPLAADVPVCISVSRKLSYISRDGTQHDGTHSPMLALPQLASLQADASWLATVGSAGTSGMSAPFTAALQSTTNPRVVFDVPAFNDLELAAMFNQPSFDANGRSQGVAAAAVNQELVPSDLDSVRLYLSINATSGSCDEKLPPSADIAGMSLVLGVYAPGGTVPVLTNGGSGALDLDASGNALTADALLTAVSPTVPMTQISKAETLSSTTAYYRALDPNNQKTTLSAWLDANCFDSTQSDFGTGAAGANGAHAVYTNNFDLGFGRDMYFIKCTAGSAAVTKGLAHVGDMASVVINYASLEQAALKQAPFLAVAMEYAGDSTSNGQRYPKFYAFAPDDRTGAFDRVSSANFDRRGEKYLPGACLACHGGSISDTTFAASANVDATFMPWDLDGLLYSDTDPAFLGNLIGGAPYTRATQMPNLNQLNTLAWQTYQTPELKSSGAPGCAPTPAASSTCIDRFAAPIALLQKWYGQSGPQGPSAIYSDSNTPDGWPTSIPAGAAPTTPSGAPDDLYHAVFARHCRSCHTQNATIGNQFGTFQAFQGFTQGLVGSGATGITKLAFQYAQMPLARLTMDRFWVDFDGNTPSAAQTLANYLDAAGSGASLPIGNDAPADAAGNTVQLPGTPIVAAAVFSNADADNSTLVSPQTGTTNTYTVSRFTGARFDFSSSLFVSTYASSFAPPPNAALVGAGTASPAFDTSAKGSYDLTLAATSASGKTAQAPFVVNVNPTPPTIAAGCPAALSGTEGSPIVANLYGQNGTPVCITPGLEPSGQFNVLQINYPSTVNNSASGWGTALAGSGWTAAVSTNNQVTLIFNSQATPGETVALAYRVTDVDGSDPLGSITFSVVDMLTANNQTIQVYPTGIVPPFVAPAVAYAIPASELSVVIPLPETASDVALVLDSGATTSSGGTVAAASSPNLASSGGFTYTPLPPSHTTFLTCDANGNDLATGSVPCTNFDTFTYNLLSNSTAQSSPAATLSLNVQATTSFARTIVSGTTNIYALLGAPGGATPGTCAGCHESGGPDASYWTFSTPLNAANAQTTWTSITGSNTPATDWTRNPSPLNAACTGTPGYNTCAAFYDNPCGGSNTHPYKLASGCAILLQWILEGAHDD
jgi:mono/diheme cytochrome c family protein